MFAGGDTDQAADAELQEEFQKDREGIEQFIKAHQEEEAGVLGTFARDMGVRLAHHAARSLFYQGMTKSLVAEPVESLENIKK